MKVGLFFTILLSIVFVGCSGLKQNFDLSDPMNVFKAVVQARDWNDNAEILSLLYGVSYPGGSSLDNLFKGIKEENDFGDFSYSKKSFLSMADHPELMRPFTPEELDRSFISQESLFHSDSKLLNAAITDPDNNLRIFKSEIVELYFFKLEGKWKIFYSKFATLFGFEKLPSVKNALEK